MAIEIRKVRTRTKKIAVEIVPDQWRDFIVHD